jgi:hypothetical protein
MRHHPWAIFAAVAVLLALGSTVNSDVPTRHAAARQKQHHQPPPARPADRTLTKYDPSDGIANAAERPAARHATNRAKPTRDETFAAISTFVVLAFWTLVAGFMAWVIWEALLGPVRWRQRRN